MSVEEGLKSADAGVIKEARGVAKGKVTKNIKSLKIALISDKDGKFLLDQMDMSIVQGVYDKLDSCHDTFQDLHERYCIYRAEETETEEERRATVSEETYSQQVLAQFSEIRKEFVRYKKALEAVKDSIKVAEDKKAKAVKVAEDEKAKADQIILKADAIVDSKSKLDCKKKAAISITSSADVDVKKTAKLMIRELVESFNDYESKVKDYKTALNASGETEGKFKAAKDYSESMTEVEDLKLQLEVIALKYNVKEEEKPTAETQANNKVDKSISGMVKLQKITCPKFSGNPRDFGQFKRDFSHMVSVPGRSDVEIGANLKEAIPEKHKHLIHHLDTTKHKEMMDVLDNKFGSSRLVIDDIVVQIEKMKPVTTDKGFFDFVEKLEKIQMDLESLDKLEEIANSTIIGKLEEKLPSLICIKWTEKVTDDELDRQNSRVKFEKLMTFLKSNKKRVEYATSIARNSGGGGPVRSVTQVCHVTGLPANFAYKAETAVSYGDGKKVRYDKRWMPCLACDVDGATDDKVTRHPMERCAVWNSLTQKDREKKVKCVKHPFKDDHTTQECTVDGRKCKFCSKDNHHFLLCSKKPPSKSSSSAAKAASLTVQSDQIMLPVMVQAQFVTGGDMSKVGTLMDLCSTDDYVTHKYARKKHIPGEDVELVVEGMGGKETFYQTKLYMVPIIVGNVRHEIPCYGMDQISSVAAPPEKESYHMLCSKFKVEPSQMRRPRTIDLLLSMRQNHLHPQPVRTKDGITLYEGKLGKVFGGSDPGLVFSPYTMSYPLSVHQVSNVNTVHAYTMKAMVREATYTTPAKTEKEILEFFYEENIGVECNPRCGGCKCGRCPTGAKQMSIKDERDYDLFKSLMHLEKLGTEDDKGPYWETRQPWIREKSELVDNKPAVLGVMHSTMRKLDREPHWRQVYEQQLNDLLKKGFAREVTEDELDKWIKNGGKVYHISHQVAVNPSSKSTPVRVVFNSSQKYRGYSLNSSWEDGTDVLNNLHGVLLRFRKDVVGGQGDVKKMFYMIRIPQEEQMMQLFFWRFPGDDKIRTFCMTRLVMGNKPSGALSMVAMRETVEMDDNAQMYPAAYETITRDAYVDNVFRTAPDIKTLKADIAEIEKVSAMGGFYYKDWIISGQDIPEQVISVQLPNAIAVDEERALGMTWDVKKDEFYMKSNLDKPGKKQKKSDVIVLIDKENSVDLIVIKPHLTIRTCLSLHAKTFDPLGLVLPTRMIGNILFRETLQMLKKDRKGKIPWDEKIDDDKLSQQWLTYFGLLLEMEKVKFARCVKPPGAAADVDPDLVTFCDGNPDAFGVAAYVVFELEEGGKTSNLLMSKAKLGPLTHKGETVRNELCGATFTSRIKIWIMQESGFTFKNHIHFLDSMIVLEMMKKQSYGYNTFAGLRVGEIQQKTDEEDWHHIPSKENISDILTRGATPDKLGPGSTWQCGPAWLTGPPSQWPVTPAHIRERKVDSDQEVQSQIAKFFKKTSQSSAATAETVLMDKDDDEVDGLVNRCGSLQKLVRSMAYVLRWAGRASRKYLKVKITDTITASEYRDAYNYLICWDQTRRLDGKKLKKLVPRKVDICLENYQNCVSHVVLGGRVRNFPVSFTTNSDIAIIPYGQLAKLIVLYHHNRHHRDVDTIVAIVRRDVWPVKVRRIASAIDVKCKECKQKRRNFASQTMGDLPSFRTQMLPSFTVVCMDLYGPMEIRDDVVKKGPRKYKKVWGVIYTCASTRAVYLDVADSYATESVLHTVRRLLAVRGDVRVIISDPGSQLVRASKELSEWRQGWDTEQLIRFGAPEGLEWKFIMANSQHQNGAAESMVKMVKAVQKSMLHAIGDTKLSLNEMFTLLAEVGNLINERPIGIKPNDKSGTDYLSPNSLLLGKCSDRINSGPFEADKVFTDDPKAAKSRFLLVQAITNQFWKVWVKLYFPCLLVRQKWHVDKRNMLVGDVCLLKDPNVFRGEWRLCEVTEVFKDDYKKVRNVQVMVKPRQGGHGPYIPTKSIYLNRHVNNLIVIVPADERDELLGELQDGPQTADARLQQDAENDAAVDQDEGTKVDQN